MAAPETSADVCTRRLAVTLEPLEYYRVIKLSQDAILASQRWQEESRRLRGLCQIAEAARDACQAELAAKYPQLDFDGPGYVGNDGTFTLTPVGP